MGYTNYITINLKCPRERFNEALKKDLYKVLRAGEKTLAGPHGEGRINITSACILFNGIGDDSYETCEFPLSFPGKTSYSGENEWFSCCKTAEKPYDKFVLCGYFVYKMHLGKFCEVASDGHQFEPEEPNGYHAYCDDTVKEAFDLFISLFKRTYKTDELKIDDFFKKENELALEKKRSTKKKTSLELIKNS